MSCFYDLVRYITGIVATILLVGFCIFIWDYFLYPYYRAVRRERLGFEREIGKPLYEKANLRAYLSTLPKAKDWVGIGGVISAGYLAYSKILIEIFGSGAKGIAHMLFFWLFLASGIAVIQRSKLNQLLKRLISLLKPISFGYALGIALILCFVFISLLSGSFELAAVGFVLVFGAIGVIRGFPKELGITTATLVTMFVLSRFGDDVLRVIDRLMRLVSLSLLGTPDEPLIAFITYSSFLAFIVFISYHAESLAFSGTSPGGLLGVFLNLGVGLLNGYLIVGTIWYYLDRFGYPVQKLGFHTPLPTPFAKSLIPILPLNLLPKASLLALIIFLLIMRAIK